MQQLHNASNYVGSPVACAEALLVAVPSVMRFIRGQMRANRQHNLTVAQFRALIFASVQDNPSLSALAEHIGLSLPAASRMVDLLVRRDLMVRQAARGDRRRVSLSLTRQGRSVFHHSRRITQRALANRFESISLHERLAICQALQAMGRLFALPKQTEAARRERTARPRGATP